MGGVPGASALGDGAEPSDPLMRMLAGLKPGSGSGFTPGSGGGAGGTPPLFPSAPSASNDLSSMFPPAHNIQVQPKPKSTLARLLPLLRALSTLMLVLFFVLYAEPIAYAQRTLISPTDGADGSAQSADVNQWTRWAGLRYSSGWLEAHGVQGVVRLFFSLLSPSIKYTNLHSPCTAHFLHIPHPQSHPPPPLTLPLPPPTIPTLFHHVIRHALPPHEHTELGRGEFEVDKGWTGDA